MTHMALTSLKKVFSRFSLVGYVAFIDNCCNVVFSYLVSDDVLKSLVSCGLQIAPLGTCE